MDNFDIIGQLDAAATAMGWEFIYGNNFYINYEARKKKYNAGDMVLTADFTSKPTYVNGRITQINYTGVVMLGQKAGIDNTKASLDETMQQKYNSRLLNLLQTLANFIGNFSCNNELDVSVSNFRIDINRFDTVIDFVVMELSFTQYP